ncbi:MAG: hypothetical protein A2W01_02645 [Candidatus Solincola sediminis]|nr:MAG: hypothetical protein A2W01_02645 [Candidatus Solincola sediminis]
MTETGGGVEERSGENLSVQVEGIDTAAIMKEIETRVEERRRQGVYKDLDLLDLEEQRGEAEVSLDPLHELIFLNQLARQYADVTSHYPIGSQRSFLGPFIMLFKKIIRRFMTPYMDALFAKQREFNAQCLSSMDTFLEMIKRERESSYHGGLDRYTAWVEMGFTENNAGLLREACKKFQPEKRIINLYSGTGDFLAVAAGEKLDCLGVEEDPRLVKIGQEKNLRILQARPLDYLESQPLDSLESVFMQDLGERGDSRELLWTITALADRLEKGGEVKVLNHHPRSVLGVEEAFGDPTLMRLIHPETMESLFRHAGFREVESTLIGKYSQAEKKAWKKKLGEGASIDGGEPAELLFAPRRYLLEARR